MNPSTLHDASGASGADNESVAARLRGFGGLGLLAIVVILAGNALLPALGALLVLVWAQRSCTPWVALGFAAPRNWVATIAGGVILGIVLKLAMKAVVLPLLGAEPVNRAYQFLAGNPAALPGMILMIVVSAGFGEETVYRGYLFERIGRLLGRGAGATAFTVALTATAFGFVHFAEQGLAGAQQATAVGLVFGAIYAFTRRIALLMIAHVVFDLTAVAIIYYGLEERVARSIFG